MNICLIEKETYTTYNSHEFIKYDIFMDMDIIGRINILVYKNLNKIYIADLCIFYPYRNKSYGKETIYELCKIYPVSIITGDIFNVEAISFWSKFDDSLKDVNSDYNKDNHILESSINFSFPANDLIL